MPLKQRSVLLVALLIHQKSLFYNHFNFKCVFYLLLCVYQIPPIGRKSTIPYEMDECSMLIYAPCLNGKPHPVLCYPQYAVRTQFETTHDTRYTVHTTSRNSSRNSSYLIGQNVVALKLIILREYQNGAHPTHLRNL